MIMQKIKNRGLFSSLTFFWKNRVNENYIFPLLSHLIKLCSKYFWSVKYWKHYSNYANKKEISNILSREKLNLNINKRLVITQGFSLIELMIVVAIIGILVAIALPSYEKYTRRAHYTEVVQAAAPFKVGIAECFQTLDSLEDCQSGLNGVPENIVSGQGAGLIDSVTTEKNSSINVVPREKYGILSSDNYKLTPVIDNNVLIWQSSGGGVTAGYAN